MNIALIDADTILYNHCFGYKDKPLDELLLALNTKMQWVLDMCGTRKYVAYISGPENFRKKLDPTYKANRIADKPPHFSEVQEYLVTKWSTKVTENCEADDELALLHVEHKEDAVLCAVDKDFLQLPGKHFHLKTEYFKEVNYEMGMFNFYRQMLMGDGADNVKGIPGIGQQRSLPLLFGKTVEEQEQVVRELYDNHNLDYELNRKLLWLARSREYLEQLQEEAHQLSISRKSMENPLEDLESVLLGDG